MSRTRRFTFDAEHMVGRRVIDLRVTYSVTPGCPEQGPTYSCGGQPAEPDEVEIIAVKHNGQPFTLSDDEEDALLQQAIERVADDMADEAAAEADYRYQEYRDRQLMERWEREA